MVALLPARVLSAAAMTQLDPKLVREVLQSTRDFYDKLASVLEEPCSEFGASVHSFGLRPCATLAEVEDFESKIGRKLPTDYRRFLLDIGNGGAGPHYGLFPLGARGDYDSKPGNTVTPRLKPWEFLRLSETFETSWRDNPCSYPGVDENELEDIAQYVPPGALPIAHCGCAEHDYLILTGENAGQVWYEGEEPYFLRSSASRRAMTFSEWYGDWLDEIVAGVRATPVGKNWPFPFGVVSS